MALRLYDRLFPRFQPSRELRPKGDGRGAAVRLSWLGTAGYILETPGTRLLIDPFITRHGLRGILGGRLAPDEAAIRRHLPGRVDAILCGHSHYDHAVDAPRIAAITGAKLIGSPSTLAWGRAEGLPEERLVEVPPAGLRLQVGDVEVRFVPSLHGRLAFGRVLLPGEVHGVPRAPGRIWDYKMGGAFGLLLRAPGVSLYHNGSADLIDAEIEGERADVLLVGLSGRQGTPGYVPRLLSALAPKLVVPTHHDAFFAPLERGFHLLPGVDLEGFVAEVGREAPGARVISPDYEEPICIPPDDARGAVLAPR